MIGKNNAYALTSKYYLSLQIYYKYMIPLIFSKNLATRLIQNIYSKI